jgi:glutaredoxin
MNKAILFSLEHCVKCTQTKNLLLDRDDIEVITLPHNIEEWTKENLDLVKTYQVFDELQKTAPILWLNGEKMVGYLRIRKWLQDTK